MGSILNTSAGVLLLIVTILGICLKFYVHLKLKEIDGISDIIVLDVSEQAPPIGNF